MVEAYKDKLHLFEPQSIEQMQELIPGVKSIASYGHTPGHTCYMVENGGQHFFIWGDSSVPVGFHHQEMTRYKSSVPSLDCDIGR